MYNDFMDELEHAADMGFDGICVNEHHQNGYGLMPSPNLIAASLARRTSDAAICVMGNSLALYNPPLRVAEEFAMLDCISGGRLVAGFPVGTPMDTCYAYGHEPEPAPRALPRGARSDREGVARAGALRLERPLPAAPLREPVAAPAAEAAPADLDPRRRLRRDLALVRGEGLRLRLPLLLRLPGRPGHDERLLGGDEAARQGPEPVPRRLPPVRRASPSRARRRSTSTASRRSTSTTAASTSIARYAAPPGYASEATIRSRVVSQVLQAATRASEREAFGPPPFEEIVSKGYV